MGQRIAKLRKKSGLSQDQFAEVTGVNRTHLYRLETGKQSMTLKTLKIVADSLGGPRHETAQGILIAFNTAEFRHCEVTVT